MRHYKTLLCPVVVAAACIGLLAGTGWAQTHRIVNLGHLPDWSENFTEVYGFGLNTKGQVVGKVVCFEEQPNQDDVARAFVWLPADDYGRSSSQLILLNDTLGLSSGARDLNTAGIAVGWIGDLDYNVSTTATYWRVLPTIVEVTLPPFQGITPYVATSIGDVFGGICGIGINGSNDHRGFSSIGGTDSILNPLPDQPPLEFFHSRAFGISGLSTIVVGSSTGCPPDPDPCDICVPVGDAAAWLTVNGIELNQSDSFPAPFHTNEIIGEGRGVNNAGNIVGFGVDKTGGAPAACLEKALLWESTSDDLPTNLGDPGMPVDPPAEALGEGTVTWANGASDAVFPSVVGRNDDVAVAAMWEFQGGDPNVLANWLYSELIHRIHPACDWSALAEAYDVETVTFQNKTSDWIVGAGRWGPNDFWRAFLMIPLGDCPWDVNGDGNVNVQDLSAVIINWGSVPEGKVVLADTNGDCVVDVQDYTGVMLHWGPCAGAGASSGPMSAPMMAMAIGEFFVGSPTPEMAAFCIELLEALDD